MDDIFEGSYYDVAVYKLEQAKDDLESSCIIRKHILSLEVIQFTGPYSQ